jgi:hypothetical protein
MDPIKFERGYRWLSLQLFRGFTGSVVTSRPFLTATLLVEVGFSCIYCVVLCCVVLCRVVLGRDDMVSLAVYCQLKNSKRPDGGSTVSALAAFHKKSRQGELLEGVVVETVLPCSCTERILQSN